MSNVLVVFGATGQQGSSVIDSVLSDSQLSKLYQIRAVTRNATSHKAKSLSSQGVELVVGDADDKPSLLKIMNRAHAIFAMTTTKCTNGETDFEVKRGKNIVDAAVESHVPFLIWSTLPSPIHISCGKYTKIASFNAKAEIESYICSRPIMSAFFASGVTMQNFTTTMKPFPSPENDGSYIVALPVSPSTRIPLIDIAGDTGKFVAAMLSDPTKFSSKTVCGATRLYSMEEQARIISRATGKTVRYQQISQDRYRSLLPSSNMADELLEMWLYQEEFGYYGLDTEESIKWSITRAKGMPISFEKFLEQNSLLLE